MTSSAATLQAQVNPRGLDTTYYFEYGPTTAYGASAPLPPGADLGAASTDQSANVRVQRLQAGTTYHYRVLATNSQGSEPGRDRTFTTPSPPGPFALPDGRAWEMVSPANKRGAIVEALTEEGGAIQAAEDGHALAYVTNAPTGPSPEGSRNPEPTQLLATRGATGWSSTELDVANESHGGYTPGLAREYRFFSTDLSLALMEPYGLTSKSEPPLSAQATERTPYIRNDATCGSAPASCFEPLATGAPGQADVPPGTDFGSQLRLGDATPDLAHVVLSSTVALTNAPAGALNLYEWSAGRLALVSELPGGKPAQSAQLGYNADEHRHAISNDGTLIYWTEPSTEGGSDSALYLTDTVAGATIRVDAAQGVAEPLQAEARFQTASSDGRRVFFTDGQKLTPDSTAGGTTAPDLYVCEIADVAGHPACRLTDLSVDQSYPRESAAVQLVVPGASEDGSYVYFVTAGGLAAGAAPSSCTPETGPKEPGPPGICQLYVRHYTGTEWAAPTLVASLGSGDAPDWGGAGYDLTAVTARVSPDGRYFAFMSRRSLTGYDNRDRSTGAPDAEVFLYDALAGRLVCASCNPTGARPMGIFVPGSGSGVHLRAEPTVAWEGRRVAAGIPGWTAIGTGETLYQSRYLSDSGRLFFNTADALVPRDTNGVEDVYEYEPTGVGGCTTSSEGFGERSDGCVALISSGTSSGESTFLDASASGNDVFFATAAGLVPGDRDGAYDAYDARVCTGASPCLADAGSSPAPPCEGAEACRPGAPAPLLGSEPFGSARFSGPGNLAAVPETRSSPGGSAAAALQLRLARALATCRRRWHRSQVRRRACERSARRAVKAAPSSRHRSRPARRGR